MNRIIKSIPNTITLLNLSCGVFSIILALRGEVYEAGIAITIAAVFDFLDGFAARALKAYSDMGKELDSLADMVSFGVAPAVIIYYFIESVSTEVWAAPIAILIVLASALRLAKFNISEEQSTEFIGLPTPANALLIVGIAFIQHSNPALLPLSTYLLLGLVLVLSFLLVSPIRMFSLKMKSLSIKENIPQYLLLAIGIVLIATMGLLSLTFIILSYIVLSIGNTVFTKSSEPNNN